MKGTCSVEDCDKEMYARGYCKTHYFRWYKFGDPLTVNRNYHGLSKSSEYNVWAMMKQRCLNKKQNNYKNYGARGIKVCDRWKNSFSAFYADIGPRPSKNHTLERLNNNLGYFPGNVVWALRSVNCRNTRRIKLNVEKVKRIRDLYKKKLRTRKELAVEFGVPVDTIKNVVTHRTWKNVA